jgi:hypothetical protein
MVEKAVEVQVEIHQVQVHQMHKYMVEQEQPIQVVEVVDLLNNVHQAVEMVVLEVLV